MASRKDREQMERFLVSLFPHVSSDTIQILFQATWNELDRVNRKNKKAFGS